ncbi:dol-P-Man:Man(5)GlcNAc(2)-PP-Dol alpha-1,3-mannosyltransferase isoform X2 [Prosopis cineraria]|uniref:dol-P-Man:Man(5)GlcNAc(2)-PP-Dol alpha-1,3-mannosyltransferase isoform X2 n=1 Tax=Prosopis cineraria TaxID=364024 RepID=UPI00240F8B02|nr:dol-P-Man:Man(5)GlcNAc(2)-PP-Dol alpha-1,3-mannosyltransferase isoform X2 [Prosopis cineraria]
MDDGTRFRSRETAVAQSVTPSSPPPRSEVLTQKFMDNPKVPLAVALVFVDAILAFLIITFVPYTKIDWDAYMSQVTGFLGGERDYRNLKGDTGPLVYPAGFLYIYSAFQYLTGGAVYPAQILFAFLYTLNLAIILLVYVKTDVGFSYLFVSGAVSVKMNVLLYAPPLLLLMLKAMDISGVLLALAGAALVQILLGLPFLASYPAAYISRAFNLSRVFIHFWSVNFKFMPEPVFISKGFAIFLLAAHLILLALFAHCRWCKHEGGLLNFLHSKYVSMRLGFALFFSSSFKKFGKTNSSSLKVLTKEHIMTTMFVGNFIGIVCARSLHYQFYSWYFHSLPYLLWRTNYSTLTRLILFMGVEMCWNIYPSNSLSSGLLLCLHLTILWGLWSAQPDYPYVQDTSSTHKGKWKF